MEFQWIDVIHILNGIIQQFFTMIDGLWWVKNLNDSHLLTIFPQFPFCRAVPSSRARPSQASQNLLRAELQSARTEASDERWQKEDAWGFQKDMERWSRFCFMMLFHVVSKSWQKMGLEWFRCV